MASKTNHNINEVGESVAVIISELRGLTKNFDDYKAETRKFNDAIDVRVTTTEVCQAKLETKTGNLAIFQSVFSIIIGAIATYLGVQGKQ